MQNEQDMEKLVHAHTAALLRYCTGLLGSEADAQDAVQKTFIKAWQQRHTLRHDGTDNERACLYRIAYRTALIPHCTSNPNSMPYIQSSAYFAQDGILYQVFCRPYTDSLDYTADQEDIWAELKTVLDGFT